MKKKVKKSFKRKFREFVVMLDIANTKTNGKLANTIFVMMCGLVMLLICIVCAVIKMG